MPWNVKYTKKFHDKALSLRHTYQKKQVREILLQVKDMENPKDKGASYHDAWAYLFTGKSLVLCEMDEDSRTLIFTDIII